MKQTTAPSKTPSPQPGSSATPKVVGAQSSPSAVFFSLAIDMSWKLALAVLVPIIGGFELDKVLHTSPVLIIIGFIVAMIAVTLVLKRSMQLANSLPVPKLTAAEKREVQKRYEEDDD